MNETKIFKRYMLRYLLVGFLVIMGSMPFAFMAYKHIRDNMVSDTVLKLESGIAELENNIQKMNMIAFMISDDQNLRSLKLIEGGISADRFLNLKYLANQMFDIRCIYDFSPMFFVMFHNNDAFVSTGQVSDDFMRYYGKFFEVEGMASAEFKNILFDREKKSPFILADRLKYNINNKEVISQNAILYVEPIEVDEAVTTNKAVIVFIIDEKKLVETLLSKECLNQGITRITDGTGNIIVNYGEAVNAINEIKDEGYIKTGKDTLKLLTYDNIKKGLKVTVGFPMSLINSQLKDIIRLLLIYAGIGFIVALILTVVFSVHWYTPFGNMIKEAVRLESNNGGKKNEFDYVRESLLKLVSVKDELETKMLLANAQKQAIMLENIFIKGFYQKEEENEFLKRFPHVKKGYYVAYFQIKQEEETDKNQEALFSAVEMLESDFTEGFIHVHSAADTEILLLPAVDNINKETLKNTFLSVNEVITKKYQVLCFVGISQRENEICNINVAYAQARQTVHAYKNINTSFVEFYQYINDRETGCFHIGFLNKLYELILCGGKKEIGKMFEEVREECISHKERYEFHKAEIYHAISFVDYAACQQLSFIPIEEIKLQKYQQNHSLIQCLNILEQSAYEICNRIEEYKKSKNLELRDKIIRYLHSNYHRADLTADIVSREAGISEKYLSAFLKEHIGKTFSVYLDELRIGYSKECLEKTNWSNERIAVESGFGAVNSFYRVFKKYVGVSPSVYKKSKSELKEKT